MFSEELVRFSSIRGARRSRRLRRPAAMIRTVYYLGGNAFLWMCVWAAAGRAGQNKKINNPPPWNPQSNSPSTAP
jgi:hypothetical protein